MKTVIDDFTQICEKCNGGRSCALTSRHRAINSKIIKSTDEAKRSVKHRNTQYPKAMSQFSHRRRNLTDPIKMLTGAFSLIHSVSSHRTAQPWQIVLPPLILLAIFNVWETDVWTENGQRTRRQRRVMENEKQLTMKCCYVRMADEMEPQRVVTSRSLPEHKVFNFNNKAWGCPRIVMEQEFSFFLRERRICSGDSVLMVVRVMEMLFLERKLWKLFELRMISDIRICIKKMSKHSHREIRQSSFLSLFA